MPVSCMCTIIAWSIEARERSNSVKQWKEQQINLTPKEEELLKENFKHHEIIKRLFWKARKYIIHKFLGIW